MEALKGASLENIAPKSTDRDSYDPTRGRESTFKRLPRAVNADFAGDFRSFDVDIRLKSTAKTRFLDTKLVGQRASARRDEKPSSRSDVFEKQRKRRKSRCGKCHGCNVPDDCGKCKQCLDMKKFGGEGRMKQKCKLRRCVLLGRGGGQRVSRKQIAEVCPRASESTAVAPNEANRTNKMTTSQRSNVTATESVEKTALKNSSDLVSAPKGVASTPAEGPLEKVPPRSIDCPLCFASHPIGTELCRICSTSLA